MKFIKGDELRCISNSNISNAINVLHYIQIKFKKYHKVQPSLIFCECTRESGNTINWWMDKRDFKLVEKEDSYEIY